MSSLSLTLGQHEEKKEKSQTSHSFFQKKPMLPSALTPTSSHWGSKVAFPWNQTLLQQHALSGSHPSACLGLKLSDSKR